VSHPAGTYRPVSDTEACPLDDIESEPERRMKRELRFDDDFSNDGLARYYTWVPGVGQASRTGAGLAYQIVRAWDGPASAEDLLTIDSLGRPQSPSTQVVFRFSGDEWTLEILVDYDFEATRNGRHAYVWVVPGAAEQRMRESVAIVRSADLARESHSLRIETRRPDAEARTVVLTATPGPRYWFRVSGARRQVTIDWSTDGVTFATGLATEWAAVRRL
jgi:hypothetical protein